MAVNDKQKIVVLTADANTQATIEAKLLLGYVIQHITTVVIGGTSKIIIVYSTPDEI